MDVARVKASAPDAEPRIREQPAQVGGADCLLVAANELWRTSSAVSNRFGSSPSVGGSFGMYASEFGVESIARWRFIRTSEHRTSS